ncbi:AAA family ATPase [Aquincola sp. S2]|uniref:AAA family ATPase n=1 Tax=Pseudaquabacterium terrae TaxID=2732868 RepID=A0ABX2EM11_9BURK|nr:AAA family ATPase [Aquabacterium terrae]NRF69610.1 AAA family ATPase [Aquabacterium terrae]
MLRLLQSPSWQTDGAEAVLLPCTLPSALAIHLAAQRGWVERERAACLFWPDRPPAEALHNLRVNLHRLRTQLRGWGLEADPLRSERQRIGLTLPTDLQQLETTLDAPDEHTLLAQRPWALLDGFRIAGFEDYQQWVDGERQRLTRAWSQAVERALGAALAAGGSEAAARLFDAWQAQELASADALERLRPHAQVEAAAALWRHWRASVAGADLPLTHTAATQPLTYAPAAQPLAGRGAEQSSLRALRAAATVVGGEPGIGKTALVTATFPGAPLLRGREGLEAVPFGPLAELLRRERGWLAAAGAYRLDIARLLPEIAPDEPLPPLDAHTAKLRLLEGLARLIEQHAPLLLVDDLQWCDVATLEWLVFVAHRGRLRWVATARTHALPLPAKQALQALRSASLLAEAALGALDAAGLDALCRAHWPLEHWPADRIQALLQRSGGNPFFALELHSAAADPAAVPQRSNELLQGRLRALPPAAQAVLEAAAVLAQPVALPVLAAVSGLDHALPDCVTGCEQALAAGLLVESAGGLECRHDLIRGAVTSALSLPRRQWLHRRAALALGPLAAPLALAQHWQEAGEPQTALTWRHRGALQHKDFGRLDEARALWQQIAQQANDPALQIRARLALAECALFEDLDAGRDALEAVLEQVAAIADPAVRDQLEAQTLAGLVDNRVFAGDQPRARRMSAQLRPLLPRLGAEERVHAIEVLIELAMREPDIDDANALLAEARRLQPMRPSLDSFEGQIHWFGGRPQAAREAFERLLERHPEYCCGLTIENDLAVMCQALGDLAQAEAMARRSLASWKGVAHTETLSLLVLGSTLTSGGRYGEAAAALDQAEQLARRQGSQLFASEVHGRRTRLLACCGRFEDALAQAERAAPLVRDDDNPLRLSQLLAAQVTAAVALQRSPDEALRTRLQAACWRSAHPLVHARLARVEVEFALAAGRPDDALAAAARMAAIARPAGLLEVLADALLLQARAAPACDAAAAWVREAATLADSQGYRDLGWRAWSRLATLAREPALAERAQAALAPLLADAPASGFDAARAALREPRCD